MRKILTEPQVHDITRKTRALLLSPQGKEWSRPFLTERGKGQAGDLGQIKREMLDILSECIGDLYAAREPFTNSAQP